MSNRALTTILVVLVLVAVIFGVFWLFTGKSATPSTTGTNPFTGLGTGSGSGTGTSGGTGSGGGTGTGTSGSFLVTAKDGSTVSVPDFRGTHQAVLEGDKTFYYLTQNEDTQGSAAQFDLIYGSDSSVTLSLLSMPLGAARKAGEASLRTFFPLSDAQLCKLNVIVAVPSSISDEYSGQNLGMSFCPGSVSLP